MYFLVPKRFQWLALLAASYTFYFLNSEWLLLILIVTTAVTFYVGQAIGRVHKKGEEEMAAAKLAGKAKREAKAKLKKQSGRVLWIGILFDLGMLLFLKYFNFFAGNANHLLKHFGWQFPKLHLLLPLGISFYTLQAMAYLIDVHRGKYEPEKSLPKFMLFMSYFPQIVQGPIARYRHLAGQLCEEHHFDYQRLCFGAQLMMWGWMKKTIIADRIAVIGFSAGGHLAASAATMSKNRPNAAILGYPVIDGGYASGAPDVAAAVDEKTCPCFVFATRTDNLVPVENSLHLLNALCRNEIAFESHIYSNGPHGLSTGEGSLNPLNFCSRYPDWVDDSITWLEDVLGTVGPEGPGAPRFGAAINGNREEKLNLNCTIAHLRRFPEARALLRELLPESEGENAMPESAGKVITLGSTLEWLGLDAEAIGRIARRLGEIENNPREE